MYIHTMYTYIHNSRHNSYTKHSGFSVSGVGRAQQQSDELRTGLQMFSVTSPEKHRLLIAFKLTFALLANYMIHFFSYCEIRCNTSSEQKSFYISFFLFCYIVMLLIVTAFVPLLHLHTTWGPLPWICLLFFGV